MRDYRLALFPRGSDPTSDTPTIEDVFGTIGWPKVGIPLAFETELNGPGRLEFELDLHHPSVTRANFAPGAAEVYLYRDEDDDPEPVWGGRIWLADVKGHTVRFAAYGFLFDLSRREIVEDYASTETSPLDVFKIVSDLLADTQDLDDLGFTEAEDYAGGGVTAGVTRAIVWCAEERALVSDAINDLAVAFDYEVSPLKALKLWAPHRGSSSGVTLDAADNVSEFNYQLDATTLANSVAGVGLRADCAVPAIYVTEDSGSIAAFGLQHGHVSPPHPEDQDAVEAEADEYLRLHLVERLQPTVEAQDHLQAVAAAPVDFYDVELGDTVSVESSRGAAGGFGEFSSDFRVLTRHVEVLAPGVETISYGLDQVVV